MINARGLQGFINSIFKLAQLPFSCPHYSYISKREVFTRTNWPRRRSYLGSREHSTPSFISLT
ncbi:hypothetical protein CGH28_24560 [Vibrio parahaemolyticus]|nr:hypothetical protein CGI59_24200 [Vibrio parahaemolyticus]TOO76540.1 hypothetical protein CGH28_24560 [Vibrio parahaemolyticus]